MAGRATTDGPNRNPLILATVAVLALGAGLFAFAFAIGNRGPGIVSPEEWAANFCGRVDPLAERAIEEGQAFEDRWGTAVEPSREFLDDTVSLMRTFADLVDELADAAGSAGTPEVDDPDAFIEERDQLIDTAREGAGKVRDSADSAAGLDLDDPGDRREFQRLTSGVGRTFASDVSGATLGPEVQRALDDDEGCQRVDETLSGF
jgi:hypothetical protein